MKRLPIVIALLLAALGTPRPVAAATTIHWLPSYQAAVAHAKTSHTLLMVDVYTDWCGWCKKLDADVYPDPAVVKAAAQFTPVKVNAEQEGKAIAAKYNVTGYPTILFLNTQGTLVGQIVGYEPAPQFAGDMTKIVNDNAQFPILQAKVKANPLDMDDTLKLAQAEARRGSANDALTLAAVLTQNGHTVGLAALYNQIGDGLASQGQQDQAIAAYQKAVAASPGQSELIAARVGIVNCLAQEQKVPEIKSALADLLTTPGISADMKQQCQAILDKLTGPQTAAPTAAQSRSPSP